ncbi:MAG: hypothetical protein MnENMB40S_11790 [Rhizobiaceae bacterium MnEN-MB40S]|nr:MAG: hypothetical protein MnENMB40S_11790 [Rhizobiaceae bacterium MnEN-MB40S]
MFAASERNMTAKLQEEGVRARISAATRQTMVGRPTIAALRRISPEQGKPGGSFWPAESMYEPKPERSWATVMLAFLILLCVVGAMLFLLI